MQLNHPLPLGTQIKTMNGSGIRDEGVMSWSRQDILVEREAQPGEIGVVTSVNAGNTYRDPKVVEQIRKAENDLPNPFDVFRHDLHVALWGFLANNPGLRKADWPGWASVEDENRYYAKAADGVEYPVRQGCFACQAIKSYEGCSRCPLDWEGCSGCNIGVFEKWRNELIYYNDWEADRHGPSAADIVSFARKIRDTPVRRND